jgi:hypothetical protein
MYPMNENKLRKEKSVIIASERSSEIALKNRKHDMKITKEATLKPNPIAAFSWDFIGLSYCCIILLEAWRLSYKRKYYYFVPSITIIV